MATLPKQAPTCQGFLNLFWNCSQLARFNCTNIKFSLEYEARGVGDIGQWLTSKVLNDNFANTFSTDLACGLTDVGFTRGRKFQTLQLVIVVQPSTVRVYSVATERAAQLPNREGFERELVAQHDDLLDTLRKAGFD